MAALFHQPAVCKRFRLIDIIRPFHIYKSLALELLLLEFSIRGPLSLALVNREVFCHRGQTEKADAKIGDFESWRVHS